MKHIGFQKIHKFNTATQVSTTFVTDKATATSWATSTNTTSAVTTSTTTTSNWTTVWLTSTNTTTTWQTSSTILFNTTSNWSTDFNTSSTWSTSSTIQTLKSTSSSFNTTYSGTTTWVTQVPKSKTTSYYVSTNYTATTSWTASTGYYANTLKSHTTSWTAAVNTTYSYSRNTSSTWTTNYTASTQYSRTTCVSGGGMGGFQCLPTGTLININTTMQRPIEELQIGDTILSKGGGFNTDDYLEMHNYDVANMTGKLRETTIIAHFETTSDDNINFNNGLLIATRTHYHLMKINNRWAIRPIYVAQLCIENNMPVYFYNIDGTEIQITSAINETELITVWEIDTEPDDVYFANGLLTHNHKRNN